MIFKSIYLSNCWELKLLNCICKRGSAFKISLIFFLLLTIPHSIQQEKVYFQHNSERVLLNLFFYMKKRRMSVEPIRLGMLLSFMIVVSVAFSLVKVGCWAGDKQKEKSHQITVGINWIYNRTQLIHALPVNSDINFKFNTYLNILKLCLDSLEDMTQ